MGAHTTVKERQEIVDRFRRSGLTQREFCETEDVTVGTLRSWIYRQKPKQDQGPRFIEVTRPRSRAVADVIELHVGDLRVVLPATIADERVVELAVALGTRMRSVK